MVNVQLLSAAALGDAVFAARVKGFLLKHHPHLKPRQLHTLFAALANAKFQSDILMHFEGEGVLTDREQSIVNRARNKSIATKAKNATREEYRNSSALEALLGVLTIEDQSERVEELMQKILEKCGEVT